MGRSRLKVLYISGTRADYQLMRPVLRAIQNDRSFELGILVTGMHLRREFGYTVEAIADDGFRIAARLDTLHRQDSLAAMSESLGITLARMSHHFAKLKPDVVLLLGDRDEQVAAAIAAAHMNIGVAQIHAGERSGSIDECNRHAISRYAHLLFAATKEAAWRLRKFGEPKFRVHRVGAPALDHLLRLKKVPRQTLAKQLRTDLVLRPYVVLLQHSVTQETALAGRQIAESLAAIRASGLHCLAIKPNADDGGRAILQALKQAAKVGELKLLDSLNQEQFANLLRHCVALIGNSSAGILEAPALGVASINIGNRQHLRLSAKSVVHVDPRRGQIATAIKRIQRRQIVVSARDRRLYGNGTAAEKIVRQLKNFNWHNSRRLTKELEY